MIKDDLLAILVCPLGRAPLRQEGDSLVCTKCGLRYAVRDGIPNMLYEEAELPEGVKSIADLACAKEAGVAAS
ncbi:Trm112 family protein [Paludisphaera sp.]|uniref:Trm112 family protein n=1 Tax=Paludisphaera sp. TaxID=2017432 RepID=UPI00301C9AD0